MNVYPFDHDHIAQWGKSPKELKDLLGGKGANLAEMTSILGLPVPHGFTITTDACRDFLASGWDSSLDDEIEHAVKILMTKMEKTFGGGSVGVPLLLSVRSGAKFSMPGMMDTVLNLGMNDQTVDQIAGAFGSRRFAYDSYRRFIAMYGRIVDGIEGTMFDEAIKTVAKNWERPEAEFNFDCHKELVLRNKEIYFNLTNREFPQDVWTQLYGAIKAVFESWNGDRAKTYREAEGIPHDIGTAVNVQAMVFGNMNDNSGTGVAFTRNPATGEALPYGDFLIKAQGEDVVAGTHETKPLGTMTVGFGTAYLQLQEHFKTLEKHYEDMCDVEFTVENGVLWILQTRVGKRADAAALRMAVEMTQSYFAKGWAIPREEAIGRVIDIVKATGKKKVVETSISDEITHIAQGLAASPGTAVGKAVFTADDAVAYSNKGDKVILVREETSPEDIHGMQASEGILTSKGGLVSHAAVVARGWNIPAVVGASTLEIKSSSFKADGVFINVGDTITIDGSTGKVYPGKVKVSAGSNDSNHLEILRGWAKKVNNV